jgi:Kunitz/Bovine pancreatic trypsin inhibitor domain
MCRARPWLMIVAGLAACVSSRVSEEDVDAGQGADSACATSEGTEACAEGAMSEEAGKADSDAGAAGLGEDAGKFPGFGVGLDLPRAEAGCEYLGQHFEDGAPFPDNDGCNSCQCSSGLTFCSLAFCLRRPAHCDLPFDPGSCDESHTFFAHNPSTGLCEAKQYSGCGGNLNRFVEYVDCAYRCSLSDKPGRDCTYEGRTYHHRDRVVRKPSEMTGCGPCLCNDGQVLCPPADCECPNGGKLGLQCVGCDGAGGCSDQEERCFPACDTDEDCNTKHEVFCDKAQGVCVSTPNCLR